LAQQVELVCRDLVGGYHRTIEKLLELQSQQDCRAAIDGQLQIKPLLGTILRYLSDSFNGASGAVFLTPFTTARARLFTTTGGGPPANIEDYDQTLINGIIQRTIQSGAPLLGSYVYDFDQTEADGSNSVTKPLAESSPRSLLAVGLYARECPIGAIVMQRRRKDPFTSQEAKLLERLRGPLAKSIELVLRLESTTS
jgi:transcriptional regulator with GAF, ATPase, and Fis domain